MSRAGLDLSVVVDLIKSGYGLPSSNQVASPYSSKGPLVSGESEVGKTASQMERTSEKKTALGCASGSSPRKDTP